MRMLASLQWRVAIRIVSAYRTISTIAIEVIAQIIPVHLRAMQLERKHECMPKGEAYRLALEEWQVEWDEVPPTGWCGSGD